MEIDLYVKDGEITFICVTDVGGVAKDDGEQGSGELDLTGVENFVCNSNIVTVDLVGTGKIPANYPVTVTLMKANSTEGDAEVGSKEHVNLRLPMRLMIGTTWDKSRSRKVVITM
ncbi:MAG: hypothetical protein ACLUIW_10310 [Dysosmobacter welbionis]